MKKFYNGFMSIVLAVIAILVAVAVHDQYGLPAAIGAFASCLTIIYTAKKLDGD